MVWAEGVCGGQRERWAERAIGFRERSDRLAASGARRAAEDWAPRSAAQWSAVRTARFSYPALPTHTHTRFARPGLNDNCH